MKINEIFSKILKKIVSKELAIKVINNLSNLYRIDQLNLAYKNNGIGNYENSVVSGELFVLNQFLPSVFKDKKLVLFDVGANDGDTAVQFRRAFPNAKIFAFEPNKETYELLLSNCRTDNIVCENIALGEFEETRELVRYHNDPVTPHASLYQDVFLNLHMENQIEKSKVRLTTLDNYTNEHKIDYIDFLKIDTEGHDLFVLKGATTLLNENRIGLIQFEFNEMNVISRVFLKDYYDCLRGYSFYRLSEKRLMPLGRYSSRYEIFRFQNILAIHPSYENTKPN